MISVVAYARATQFVRQERPIQDRFDVRDAIFHVQVLCGKTCRDISFCPFSTTTAILLGE